jgi:surfactin synthase thioesterase subunit/acyl carrier protein
MDHVRAELARVLRARPEDIADDLPFQQLGMDSLVGLEVRNRLEASFGIELPATIIYTHPDIATLSRFILYASGLSAQADDAADGGGTPADGRQGRAWVLRPAPRGPEALRLLVFPYSGGSASGFVQWASRLPDHVELCAIELPGHGFRLREAPLERFDALLDALDRQLTSERTQPYALFGHSMGALLAFELTRRWCQDGKARPRHLFVSGLPAPQWFTSQTLREAIAAGRQLEHLERWGLVSKSGRNRELLEMGMPALRADLAALATWSYQPGAPLACPISALRGSDDALTPLDRTEDWRRQTANSFRLVTFPGDHFYLHAERGPLLRVLVDDLAASEAGPGSR